MHVLNVICQKPISIDRNTIKYTVRILFEKSGDSEVVMFWSSQASPFFQFFPADDPIFTLPSSNVNMREGKKKGQLSKSL